jgi:WD40 repeat protein
LFALRGIAFSPDSKTLVSVGDRGPIIVWDAVTGQELWSFQSHTNPASGVIGVDAVAFAPDGKTFATGGDDRVVRVWDLARKEERLVLRDNPFEISSIAYSPDAKLLVAACGSVHDLPGHVQIWDAATGRQLARWRTRESGVQCIRFSPDGKKLAVGAGGGPNGYVDLCDVSAVLKQ